MYICTHTFIQVKSLLGEEGAKIVVGLHCCGGLTDAVINLAVEECWPFLVCSCKFRSHGACVTCCIPSKMCHVINAE